MTDRNFNFEPQSPWERVVPERCWAYVPFCGSHPRDDDWWGAFHEQL